MIVSLFGFALALLLDWPQQPAPGAASAVRVTPGDVVGGTATSLPLFVLLLLAGATAVVRWLDRGVGGAVVVLGLLGIVSLMAGIASFSSVSPTTPAEVLDAAGAVYALCGLALAVSAALAMRERLAATQAAHAARTAEESQAVHGT